jgi:AraC-like DNA-binding protein
MDRGSFAMRPCALPHVEAVEARSSHTFPRHTHDSYGIGLIVRGAQRSWSGRGMVEAGRGDLITCNPGEVHDGAPIGDTRWWKIVYLAPRIVAEIVVDIRDGASADFEFVDPVIQGRVQAHVFEAAYDALTGRCAEAEWARERLVLLLAGLLERRASLSVLGAPDLARAKARIDDDPTTPITLAELAREAGASRFQLLRAFAKFTGLTPHAYIVQRRLDAARTMIARGHTLANAATACGFADQSHLSRAFARRYGVTPGAYADAVC